MSPKVYFHTAQVNRLWSSLSSGLHKGIAFEWVGEGVIHAHIEFPEIAPAGMPILAFFKLMAEAERAETPEQLMARFEPQLKSNPTERLEQVLGVFLHRGEGNKFLIEKTLLKRFNQVVTCQPVLIPTEVTLAVPEDKLNLKPVLATKKVVIVGAGSFGSVLATEIAQSGVGNLVLFDFDTLSADEIHRFPGGLNDIGRFKTKIVRDLIRQKNPSAKVLTHEKNVLTDTEDLRKEIATCDLLLCLTNEDQSADWLNHLAVHSQKPALYARVEPGAAVSTIFHYQPGRWRAPCLCCLGKFGMVNDRGKISHAQLDEPTAPRPEKWGSPLSDLLPTAHLLHRLALQELTQSAWPVSVGDGWQPGPNASLYFWANQRVALPDSENEPSTGYACLAWHPMSVEKVEGCTVCG